MIEIEDIENIVGKRILWKLKRGGIYESIVEEISPNKDYIRLDNRWLKVERIKIVDVLPDLEV